MNTAVDNVTTINMQGFVTCPKYYARKIWEAIYRAADCSRMKAFDSFLCDLGGFSELIEKQWYKEGKDVATMWWVGDVETPFGWTDLLIYCPEQYLGQYNDKEVVFQIDAKHGDKITITKLTQ